MIKWFFNKSFNVNIKWKDFTINKCKVKDIPKMLDFSEVASKYNWWEQIYMYINYVATYINEDKIINEFIETMHSIDDSVDLTPIIKELNDWLYWPSVEWDWKDAWDKKNILKSILFIQKYYWLSENDLYNLTLEQLWYYTEMVLAIENPEEYNKIERDKKARSWEMTLDELKSFIFNK